MMLHVTALVFLLVVCAILIYERRNPINWPKTEHWTKWRQWFTKSWMPFSFEKQVDLMTKEDLERAFAPASWQRKSYDWYSSTLLDQKDIFPCVYATKGYRGREQLFITVDSNDISSPDYIQAVAAALRSYLPQSRQLGPNTSLVVLTPIKESNFSVNEYNLQYWHFLRGLTSKDKRSWPVNIPEKIDTPRWCFCFNGEPVFSAILTPAHHARRSRHSPFVCVVFQPKWIFDILFSTQRKREGATEKVRGLLKQYDNVEVSPELRNYGDEEGREARQYFLMDDNVPSECPFMTLTK